VIDRGDGQTLVHPGLRPEIRSEAQPSPGTVRIKTVLVGNRGKPRGNPVPSLELLEEVEDLVLVVGGQGALFSRNE